VGVLVDSATGVISGRPTAIQTGSSYTITAIDPSGNALSTKIDITVNAVGAGVISYGASALTFTAGIPGRTLTPQVGDTVTGWSIAPQLPPGLVFSTSDGSISGTPTSASPRTPYTVTAQGPTGALSVTFAVEVDTDVLVDLGHNAQIWSLQFNGSSVLSEDVLGHWVLWDYGTGAMVASGDAGNGDVGCIYGGCTMPGAPAALAGPTAVIRTPTGLQVRSATSGALTANITAQLDWWSLATDGSYIVGGYLTGVSVWSQTGQLLISHPGNYANAIAFASPGAIRIIGPAGANVVETISVPSGADVISPQFKGQFTSWFVDGSGFLSTVLGSATTPTILLAYSDGAAQQASIANPVGTSNLAGPSTGTYAQGAWLWTFTGTSLIVYALASPTTPVASYTFGGAQVIPSASTIGVWDLSSGQLSVIDLSGPVPAKVDYASPFGITAQVLKYAATSASQWISGYDSGVLLDGASLSGAPRFLDYGQALSVVGNASRIAIATASGRILYFNAVTLAQEGAIPFSSNEVTYAQYESAGLPGLQLALSSDGTILAVLTPGGLTVDVYSLPSGSLLHTWPYPPSAGLYALDISLSGDGTVLGTTAQSLPVGYVMQTASPATGGAPIASSMFLAPNSSPEPLRLSPDGTQIATSAWGNPDVVPDSGVYMTNLMRSGVFVPFVSGWPVGWIDNAHLLVNSYVTDSHYGTQGDYAGCTVYDLTGNATGACALPEVLAFQLVDSDTLYALNQPQIVSVSTGTVSWMSGDNLPWFAGYMAGPSFANALAGNHVVLVTDSRLVAQSY
jgi:hypothetical protein